MPNPLKLKNKFLPPSIYDYASDIDGLTGNGETLDTSDDSVSSLPDSPVPAAMQFGAPDFDSQDTSKRPGDPSGGVGADQSQIVSLPPSVSSGASADTSRSSWDAPPKVDGSSSLPSQLPSQPPSAMRQRLDNLLEYKPPPRPEPAKGWRQVLARLAVGMGGSTGAAFAPLIEHGFKGAEQEKTRAEWEHDQALKDVIAQRVIAQEAEESKAKEADARLQDAVTNRNWQNTNRDSALDVRRTAAGVQTVPVEGGTMKIGPSSINAQVPPPPQPKDQPPLAFNPPPQLPVGPIPQGMLGAAPQAPQPINGKRPFMSPAQFNAGQPPPAPPAPQQPIPVPQIATQNKLAMPPSQIRAAGIVNPGPGYNVLPSDPRDIAAGVAPIAPTKTQQATETAGVAEDKARKLQGIAAEGDVAIGPENAAALHMPPDTKVPRSQLGAVLGKASAALKVALPKGILDYIAIKNDAKRSPAERAQAEMTIHDMIETYRKEHPGGGMMGTYIMVEGADGQPRMINNKTLNVVGDLGVQPKGTVVEQRKEWDKILGTAQEATNYATSYGKSGNFTGPKDEALQEKYFEVAKPSTGFRMSQPQLDMLARSQSWVGSAEQLALHAETGQWFPPQLRNEIIASMQDLYAAKQATFNANPFRSAVAAGGGGPLAPVQVKNATEYNALPSGTPYIDPKGNQGIKK